VSIFLHVRSTSLLQLLLMRIESVVAVAQSAATNDGLRPLCANCGDDRLLYPEELPVLSHSGLSPELLKVTVFGKHILKSLIHHIICWNLCKCCILVNLILHRDAKHRSVALFRASIDLGPA